MLEGACHRIGMRTASVREIDGGIKTDNIARVASAGADTFVAGSAILVSRTMRR
jgi:ribulose-phosphate 3-epimerase